MDAATRPNVGLFHRWLFLSSCRLSLSSLLCVIFAWSGFRPTCCCSTLAPPRSAPPDVFDVSWAPSPDQFDAPPLEPPPPSADVALCGPRRPTLLAFARFRPDLAPPPMACSYVIANLLHPLAACSLHLLRLAIPCRPDPPRPLVYSCSSHAESTDPASH